jgi:hypothetical protein
MGELVSPPENKKPLDKTFEKLKDSNEILQYLTPLSAHKVHIAPPANNTRFLKIQKTEKGAKGQEKGNNQGGSNPKVQLP